MIRNLVDLLRIKHWSKNLLVFAPLIFAGAVDWNPLSHTVIAFLCLSFMASVVYIYNDINDRNIDQNNPFKKERPIASGKINVKSARFISSALFLLSLLASYFFLDILVSMWLLLYFFINLLYTKFIKNIVILDVITIAIGFVIRVIIGGIGASVPVTDWFLVMIFFISMFMGFGKRRGEILLEEGIEKRKVIGDYSINMLDTFMISSGMISLISYSIFTINPNVISKFHTQYLFYTIPIVVYGIFRYTMLVLESRDTDPSTIIFKEPSIYLTICVWLVVTCFIIF